VSNITFTADSKLNVQDNPVFGMRKENYISKSVSFTGVLSHHFTGVLSRHFTGVLSHHFTGVLSHHFTGVLSHHFTGVLSHHFTGVLSHHFTGVLLQHFKGKLTEFVFLTTSYSCILPCGHPLRHDKYRGDILPLSTCFGACYGLP
jgi:hypothetical protein